MRDKMANISDNTVTKNEERKDFKEGSRNEGMVKKRKKVSKPAKKKKSKPKTTRRSPTKRWKI